MVCLTTKFQKCGKKSCHCVDGKLHGPYWWLIIYQKKTKNQKGKYYWIYLGKDGFTFEKNSKFKDYTKHWNERQRNEFREKIRKLRKSEGMNNGEINSDLKIIN